MKLLENMEELGGSIHEAIKNLVEELFDKQLSDEEVASIVSSLKLSDILMLDKAYTDGNQEEVAKILGTDLVEYSMGGGRQATSTAANRPAVTKREPAELPKRSTDTGSSNASYSGGVQNGVTTKNIDYEDDMTTSTDQDEEEIEESDMPEGIESAMRDMAEKYQAAMAGMSHEDPNDIIDMMQHTAKRYGLHIDDYLEESSNVIDFIKEMKNRAGIK